MLKAKKVLYLFSIAALAASGCCLPKLPFCNECLTNALQALSSLVTISGAFVTATPATT